MHGGLKILLLDVLQPASTCCNIAAIKASKSNDEPPMGPGDSLVEDL